jgi:hypothetical protein
LVFLAVFIILLTPADDGPVMSLRDRDAGLLALLVLLALAAPMPSVFIPQFRRSMSRALDGVIGVARGAPSHSSPLLC